MLYTSYGTPISYQAAATRFQVGSLAAQYTSSPSSRTHTKEHTPWNPEMGTAFITPFDPPEIRALKYGTPTSTSSHHTTEPTTTYSSPRRQSSYLYDSELPENAGQSQSREGQKASASSKGKPSFRRLLKNAIKQSCKEFMGELSRKHCSTPRL